MAKGKNSAALFEVIRKDRPLTQQKSPGILQALSDRFASRSAPAPAPEPPPPAPVVAPTGIDAPGLLDETPAPSPAREIHIRLRYSSAVIAAMALATVIAGAFLVGEHVQRSLRPAISAETGAELRAEPPQPGVVNVARPFDTVADADPGNPGAASTDASAGAATADNILIPRTRKPGANYIVIQSYPKQEYEMAEGAVKSLHAAGIEATIEKGLPGWGPPDWYTVLGMTGFDRISSTQCEAYIRKVKAISEDYAKRGSFKAFDPKPYKWGKGH